MTTRAPPEAKASEPTETVPDFSIVAGGPFHRLLRSLRLVDEQSDAVNGVAILALPLLLWVPLLVFSIASGQAVNGTTPLPFFSDFAVHIRFLLALPLLLIAEVVTEQRMRPLLARLFQRNLVPAESFPALRAATKSLERWRDSIVPEVLLVVFVYGFGILFIWRQLVAVEIGTWYQTASTQGSVLSWAGIWYAYVSLPVFQFILCRWYFRLVLWARFLWQVSMIRLDLLPAHPDRMGGLGFIMETLSGFLVLAAAHGTLLAAHLSTRVILLRASLMEYKTEIAAMIVFVLFITLGPLIVFGRQLRRTKRVGMDRYGVLAADYVAQFNAKWLRGNAPQEGFMGSADIQSLADLGNSYGLVSAMRTVPITMEVVGRIVVAKLLPVAPLLLTAMPIDQIVKKLISILL